MKNIIIMRELVFVVFVSILSSVRAENGPASVEKTSASAGYVPESVAKVPDGLSLRVVSPDTLMMDSNDLDSVKSGRYDSGAVVWEALTPQERKEERLKNEHHVMYVGSGTESVTVDSLRYIMGKFYENQFRSFQDPLAPYFLLMSRDGKLAMGIGGAVRMRGWFDFDGAMPVNGFVPYLIPVPSDPKLRRRVGGTPGGTSLFFRIIGRNKTLGDITGYIQCDFSGPDNVIFKLKKAYVTIADWTVGYASRTFSDPMSDVPTIDGAGSNGRVSNTAMLVRWMHTFKEKWQVAASVEMPSSQSATDNVLTETLNDWMPDYSAFLQYQWSHQSHVRLSGIVRTLPYRDLVAKKNRNIVGWGAQLSTVFHPLLNMTVYGAFNIGRGYTSLVADLSIGNNDLQPIAGVPGRMYSPLAFGLNLGVRYNFTDKVYSCVAFGQARYLPAHEISPTSYKYGQYGAVNIFWEPTTRLQVGAEYLIGKRQNFNREHGLANRVDVLFQFSF